MMATKWGVLSAGKISHDFVSAVRSLPSDQHQFVAVAARDSSSANAFATLHKIPKAYSNYKDLAKDRDVEVVYIGTINTQHVFAAKLMLENGKHVLLEKPLTLNSKCSQDLIAFAKSKGLFFMEAVWSRFLPSWNFVKETVNNGIIGDVYHVSVNFGVKIGNVDRVAKKELGGGTMLDIGVYCLNMIEYVFDGEMPSKITAVGHLNDDGVDESVCASLLFTNGRTASLATNVRVQLPSETHIVGTKGILKLPFPFWCADKVYLNDVLYEFPFPPTVEPCNFWNSSGLRYEAMEVRNCLLEGRVECERMKHSDTMLIANISDEIRRQVGVVFDVD